MMKRSILYVLWMGWLLGAVSCTDDEIRPFDDVPKGETTVNMAVDFNPLADALAAKTRATAGDAIKAIENLCVLVYNVDGDLLQKHALASTDYTLTNEHRDKGDANVAWSGKDIAETVTPRAEFKLEKMPYGYYRIYAVANMGDMKEYEEEIKTVKGLKGISLTWQADVAKNNQMLGHFTPEGTYTDNDVVKINQPGMTLRAGVKRVASKVTVAFDGSNLNEGVFIYIKSIKIKDIPKNCFLGDANTPKSEEELTDGDTIRYDLQQDEEGNIGTVPFDEHYLARIAKGKPYLPYQPNNPYEPNFHRETERSLFFFENMQGIHEQCDKRQDANGDGKLDHPGSSKHPTSNYRPKDGVPYGTYIEVEAYYNSIHPDRIGHGDIVYRFMLGKNVTTDYNAERNHHYKLTLKFNKFANDADWHIDYEEPDPSIQVPEPYYISYLYNHQVNVPVKISTGGRKLISFRADIDTNSWAPHNVKYLDYHKALDPFSKEFDGTLRNWNGFLSLRKTKTTVIGNGTESADAAEGINQDYYTREHRGDREYLTTVGTHGDEKDGYYTVSESKNEPNTFNISLPMWTRAKQLVKASGYTGNNPYVAYQRKAVVKYTAVLRDAAGKETKLEKCGTILQVRRVVNPKGIWRKHNGTEPFHVVLKRLPRESSTAFETFPSEGKWKAYQVVGNTGFIKLSSADRAAQDTIKGESGTLIDFTVNFNGICGENENRCAIIRVEYHDYSCYHLIFVRQGSAPMKLMDNSKTLWHACNMRTETQEAGCPLEEGSMFKFGNWKQPIDATFNNLDGLELGQTEGWRSYLIAGTTTKATWDNISFEKDKSKGFSDIVINGKTVSVASGKDYNDLWDHEDIGFGFGVMYGDDGTETLTDVTDVYGHRYDRHQAGKGGLGMRGIFVYNVNDGRNLFFPIGVAGYGRRKDTEKNGWDRSAVLRYSQNRVAPLADNRPLFYDLYMRPGAIYWLKNEYPILRDGADNARKEEWSLGWDFNYFTFDFNFMNTGNVYKTTASDACFVRCVEYEP
ncbi:MAG: DUF4906 domain-containing protein [Odoribacter sp.]|nr:DUF4906 domain-containing protein [Odoribacter sp.]